MDIVMLDFYKNGYHIESDGELINISLDSKLIISYHPKYGETVTGVWTPNLIVEARETLEYARNQMECV
jgi:hypothetical protein